MSLDLGSPVLDVAFGLSFVFFLLSVIASAIGEGIAWGLKLRAKGLAAGLKGILGSSDATAEDGAKAFDMPTKILDHPLVQSDVNSASGKKNPSYVSARNFALALTQTLKEAGGVALNELEYGKAAAKQIEDGFERIDPKLKEQLAPLWREAEKDLDKFRRGAEQWFDDAMDRVSGWYRRWSQWIAIGVALLLAIILNASAVRIADRLYNDEAVRSAVVSAGESRLEAGETTNEEAGKGEGDEVKSANPPTKAGEDAQEALDDLATLGVPILWGHDNSLGSVDSKRFWETVAGWLITALAISLGAPFWFDALGKISRLRTTGARPESVVAPEPPPAATVQVVAAPAAAADEEAGQQADSGEDQVAGEQA